MRENTEKIEVIVAYTEGNAEKPGTVTNIGYKIMHDGKPVYSIQMTPKRFRYDHSPVREFHRWLLSNKQSSNRTNFGKSGNYTLRQRWIDFLEIFQLRCKKFYLKTQLCLTKLRIKLSAAVSSFFKKI